MGKSEKGSSFNWKIGVLPQILNIWVIDKRFICDWREGSSFDYRACLRSKSCKFLISTKTL